MNIIIDYLLLIGFCFTLTSSLFLTFKSFRLI